MCFTVPPDTLKLQFAESGVPEALSEMVHSLQGGSNPHDLCSIKIASNLIVSLLLGGEYCECILVETLNSKNGCCTYREATISFKRNCTLNTTWVPL